MKNQNNNDRNKMKKESKYPESVLIFL